MVDLKHGPLLRLQLMGCSGALMIMTHSLMNCGGMALCGPVSLTQPCPRGPWCTHGGAHVGSRGDGFCAYSQSSASSQASCCVVYGAISGATHLNTQAFSSHGWQVLGGDFRTPRQGSRALVAILVRTGSGRGPL